MVVGYFDMPLRTIRKLTTYKYKYINPKKVIKTGSNKGKRQRVIRTKGKSKTRLDKDALAYILTGIAKLGNCRVTIEQQFSISNRSRTIYENYGILVGMLYSTFPDSDINEVTPSQWKKALKLDSNKNTSIALYEKMYGKSDLRHDIIEAILISHIYKRKKHMDKKTMTSKITQARKLLDEVEASLTNTESPVRALAAKMKELNLLAYRTSISDPVLTIRVNETLDEMEEEPEELTDLIAAFKTEEESPVKNDFKGEKATKEPKKKKSADPEVERKLASVKELKKKQDKKKSKKKGKKKGKKSKK